MHERDHSDAPVEVSIVPHTHWDREWYTPFEATRARLLDVVDELLELLEADPAFTAFLLDGQTALLDDYLELRPESRDRLVALVRAGRAQIGPWTVLMDELVVSGETIVRNLQRGIARATELGGVMEVGYLPDMFGHVAQMPQLLRLAGFEHAVVWRGVPAAIERTAFWWRAPDGSRVRAEYLYGSYSNGRDLPDDAASLVARAHGYLAELGPARIEGAPVLLMNGSDHLRAQPWLPRVVAAANAAQHDVHFAITSLPAHLLAASATPSAAASADDLPLWRGELRSGARAPVLMGVASNRVDVHQLCVAAERAVERSAEPLAVLHLPRARARAVQPLLELAWQNLVLNSAHDSACACSHDDVVEAVRVRYEEARHLADAVTADALEHLAASVGAPAGSFVVANPSARDRDGVVVVEVAGTGGFTVLDDEGRTGPAQVLTTDPGHEGLSTIVTGRKIRWVLEQIRGPELAGMPVGQASLTQTPDGTWEAELRGTAPGEDAVDLEALRHRLLELGDEGATIRVRQLHAPRTTLAFAAEAVPGYGWRSYRVAAAGDPAAADPEHHARELADERGGARAEGERTLVNEHLRVEVDAADGTLHIVTADGVAVVGAHRLVDGGDGGDTYNYSPPGQDVVVEHPETVDVRVLEPGPLVARLRVTARYRWPVRALGDERACWARSDETSISEVETTVALRAHEPFVRLHVELDHHTSDHRLRAHVPLPRPVAGSAAECAFAVVQRGLRVEGGPQEAALPTLVSHRFVDASDGELGVGVLHDGLLEYEVLDRGRELALTLLRATGYLSRAQPSLRPVPAGPLDPLEGPQLVGRRAFDYALLPHRGTWEDARLHAAADAFLVPLLTRRGGGVAGAGRPARGQALRVDGAEVSALARDGDDIVLRLFNPTSAPVDAVIERDGVGVRGDVVDLRGRTRAAFAGTVTLAPAEIVTLRFAAPD
jgi:hypothetical protein